jgi:hypothetical protein
MSSALQKQLQRLQKEQTNYEDPLKGGKASLINTARDAADVRLEDIFDRALLSFENLRRKDGRFDQFSKSLFSSAAGTNALTMTALNEEYDIDNDESNQKNQNNQNVFISNRDRMDQKESEKLDRQIDKFLRLLSQFFLEQDCANVLEYLIRKFKVNVYNVDMLLGTFLPYHATVEFVKLAQTCNMENAKKFQWMQGVKESGAAPPREALAKRAAKDKAFLQWICDTAVECSGGANAQAGPAQSFYVVLMIETLDWLKRIEPSHLQRFLAYLEPGLHSKATSEHYAGCLMLTCKLSSKTTFSEAFSIALLEGVSKGARAPLIHNAMQTLLVLCSTQNIEKIPDRTFKHFVKISDASEHMAEISEKYGEASDCLINPLLESLGKFVSTHENYEKTLLEALEKIELTESRAKRLIPSLARSDKSDDSKRSSIERALRAADQRFPKATAEAVDCFLRELERRKDKQAHAERRERIEKKKTELIEKEAKGMSSSESADDEDSDDDADADDDDDKKKKIETTEDQMMIDENQKEEEEKAKEELEALKADLECASFLRDALAGSASGPIENKKLGNRSLAAALDHPTASIRENATQRLIDLHTEYIEKKKTSSNKNDGEVPPPPGLEKGGFLADALCRRCSDDDPTVAALALSAPSLNELTKNCTSLFEAISKRLKIARELSSRSNERETNQVADVERRVCKKAYSALLKQLSMPSASDRADDDNDELKTLRDKAAALACFGAVAAAHSRAVARSVVKDASKCNHPILLGFTHEKKAIEQAFTSAEDAKDIDGDAKAKKNKSQSVAGRGLSKKDVRQEGDARIAASVIHAIGYGFNKIASSLHQKKESFDLELWVRESYRDTDSSGKLTLLLALKSALAENMASSDSASAFDYLRKTIWTTLKDDWEHGCVSFNVSRSHFDDRLKDGKVAMECFLSLSDSVTAKPWVPAVSRALIRDLFSKITKIDSESLVVENILIESFDKLAGSESSETNESSEIIVQDLLRKCLDASSHRGVDSARFLASRIIVEDGKSERSLASTSRAKICALEMIQSEIDDIKDSDEIISALLVACASSVSSVRRAAADALYCAPTTSDFAPFAAAAKARAQIGIEGASAVRTSMRNVNVSSEDTKRLLKPITAMKAENLFGSSRSIIAKNKGSSSFCLMNPHAARVLLFILRGVGDDYVKAVEIARSLEYAVSFDSEDTNLETAAFAIEAIRCFVGEKLAASAEQTSGKFAFNAFLKAMKSNLSVSVRIACFEQIASGTYPLLKLPPNSRAKVLDVLFQANKSDGDKNARMAARAAIASVPLDCKDAVVAVSGACKFVNNDVVGLKEGDLLANAVAAMEVFSWRSETAVNRDALIEPCQNLCRALFAQNEVDINEDLERQMREKNADTSALKKKKRFFGGDSDSSSSDEDDDGNKSDNDSDGDVNEKRLNEQIAERSYALTLSLQTLTKLAEICQSSDNWDIDLVCVSASRASEGSSRAAALELLSEMAKVKPEVVVKKVVDVATTLSRIAGENDDVTLQRALENALKSVVPVWLSSGKADLKDVIWTIVEASTRAPERRRAPLCAALIRACPERKGLSELILQVLSSRKTLEKSADAHKKKMHAIMYGSNDGKVRDNDNDANAMDLDEVGNADDDDDDYDDDDDKITNNNGNATAEKKSSWVLALVSTLLGHEKPVNAVVTLVDAMKVCSISLSRARVFFFVISVKNRKVSSLFVFVSMMNSYMCQDSDFFDENSNRSAAFLLRNKFERLGTF